MYPSAAIEKNAMLHKTQYFPFGEIHMLHYV